MTEVGLNLRGFWSSILKAGQLRGYCCRLSLSDQIQKVSKDGYSAASLGTSFRATVNFFPIIMLPRWARFSSQSLSFVFPIYTRVQQQASILSTADFLRVLLGLTPCKCHTVGSDLCILAAGACCSAFPPRQHGPSPLVGFLLMSWSSGLWDCTAPGSLGQSCTMCEKDISSFST